MRGFGVVSEWCGQKGKSRISVEAPIVDRHAPREDGEVGDDGGKSGVWADRKRDSIKELPKGGRRGALAQVSATHGSTISTLHAKAALPVMHR